ncbi:MAG: AAC(3) family N-acetyltransferase [Lentisphaeria bacterium]|nr:AAC(3) family N-acetyltransferase [Lentisphaeria bacterium]
MNTTHTKESLTADLVRGGLRRTDTVLVHSSMKSIGDVAGRADTVLDALTEYFAPSGLLVLPTLSWRLNENDPVFDPGETASQVGILPELFRRRPGVIRSWHPTHSVAAAGRDAAEFTAGHEKFDTPCARNSPWGRFFDRGGRIVFIGASIAHNTFFHALEEWYLPREAVFRPRQEMLYVQLPDRRIPVPSWRHRPNHSSLFAKPEAEMRRLGILKDFRFGDAPSCIIDSVSAAALVKRLLAADPLCFTPQEK